MRSMKRVDKNVLRIFIKFADFLNACNFSLMLVLKSESKIR
jgi:hypothetical protein